MDERETHEGKMKRADLLLLKLLLILLSQILDDTLMRLHKQTVLLVPLAVQQISLPCQRLIPVLISHVTGVQLLCNNDNNNNLHVFQLIVLARYLLGVPNAFSEVLKHHIS